MGMKTGFLSKRCAFIGLNRAEAQFPEIAEATRDNFADQAYKAERDPDLEKDAYEETAQRP